MNIKARKYTYEAGCKNLKGISPRARRFNCGTWGNAILLACKKDPSLCGNGIKMKEVGHAETNRTKSCFRCFESVEVSWQV